MRGQRVTGCILADALGLGKTLTTIGVLYTYLRTDALYKQLAKQAIVVVPASLIMNWNMEIIKWLGKGSLSTTICMGTKK